MCGVQEGPAPKLDADESQDRVGGVDCAGAVGFQEFGDGLGAEDASSADVFGVE